MANWGALPMEVKTMIVKEFAIRTPEELVDLCEADKEMKFLTDVHFGAFYFEKIALFNSEYAVKELMDMVGSPAIGPCIRHIVLSALRLEPDGCFQWVKRLPVNERHSVETGTSIYDDLTAVFANLKEYKQPITIGITDEFSDENYNMLGFSKKLDGTDCGDFETYNVTADEVDAFDTITGAAEEAGCQIQGLEVKLYPRRNCSKIELAWGYYDFPMTLARYLSPNKNINVHIETQIGKKSQKAINVAYDKKNRRLSIKHSRIPVAYDTWMLEYWIEKIDIKQVHFEDMKIRVTGLESLIESNNCNFLSDHNLKAVLEYISTITTLTECLIVKPKISSGSSVFMGFFTTDRIDGSISFTGDVAKQVTEKLQSWESLDIQVDDEADEEPENEDSDEGEDTEEEQFEDEDDEVEEGSEESEEEFEESEEEFEEKEDSKDGDYEESGEDDDEDED